MYLKRLDMYGFKSFMDKLSISFDYAITAIVGPNGSGKSNITDAIRWVLGEQSVKSLRGRSMEDVIFAGTATHKPLGFAEVSLTLDNSSGLFASSYSEITVTRRVYRSGEGEYFINKTPCRLKDIHELFMDTGLGKDGYSIISQGQIDSILSAKSEDRRQIFEEAAGISKYKYKKNEASRKLSVTEENLVRIRDIVSELSARVTSLETQAKKARTYLELYEKLKTLEVNLSIIDIEKSQAAKAETEQKLAVVSTDLDTQTEKLHEMQSREQALYSEIKNRDAEMDQTRFALHSAALSIKGWEGDNALLAQRIETAHANAKKAEENIAKLKTEIISLSDAAQAARVQIETLKNTGADTEKDIAAAQQKLQDMTAAITSQNKQTEDLSAIATQLLAQAEETARRLTDFTVSDLQNRADDLRTDLKNAEMRLSDIHAKETAQKEKKQATEALIHKTEETFRKRSEERQRLETDLLAYKNTYNEDMRLYNRTLSRKNALEDMERSMEGYGKGVKAVLGAHLRADIHGVLSKLIHTDPDYVTAIETALGGALQNIVAGSEEDAKAAIAYLKETRQGRATFLPISAIRGKRLEQELRIAACAGYIGLGCDLVRFDEKYRQIILHLLGNVVIMDNIDHAIAAARKFSHQFKIVTTDGEVLMRGGSMSGGSRPGQANLLGREDTIAKLDKECRALQTKMPKTEDKIDDLADRIHEITEEMDALRTDHGNAKAELLACEGAIRLAASETESEKKHISRLSEDLKSTLLQIENADAEKERLANAEADLRARYALAVARTEEARAVLKRYMDDRSRQNEHLMQLQIAANSCVKDLEAAIQAETRQNIEIKRLQDQIQEMETQKAQWLQTARDLQLRHQNRQTDIAEAAAHTDALQKTLAEMADAKSTADAHAADMRTAIQEQNERLYALQGEKARLEARLEKTQSELDATITHLWDTYELTFSLASEQKTDIGSVSAARTEAAQLRRSIRALGSVNTDAVSEYAAVLERYNFLQGQITDLEKAMTELRKIIADMTHVMKETFSRQFALIADQFKETFRALFGGGTANLSLSDPENILESGIDIDVQPPGKKLQSLMLLSGGEKALTAIAILFSVMRVHPAPFCILDEIESALDDHNIARFSAYLRDYADTQFIIVTHRRGTMEAADVLYGVTMQEKGISKLLTMQLDDIPKETSSNS